MTSIIKVATYNVHKCVGLDRKRNADRILEVLREIDADIIALQETDRRFGQRETCLPLRKIEDETPWKRVGWTGGTRAGGTRSGSMGWHGNAILVRDAMTIHRAQPIILPALEPRGALCAEIGTDSGPVRIIGVHLDLSGLWRRRQIRHLLGFLDQAPRHIPTVIMGDFNQWTARGALSEFAFHHHRIIKTPNSFHAARPVAPLDRIIVSHDIGVNGCGAHMSALARKASDHLPIWAELKLP